MNSKQLQALLRECSGMYGYLSLEKTAEKVLEALKKDSIAFAEWTQLHDWSHAANTTWEKGEGMWIGRSGEEILNLTSEELYKIYTDDQTDNRT